MLTKTRTTIMIGATTLGLALAGATAASAAPAADDFSPREWAHQLMAGAGLGGGEGAGAGEAAEPFAGGEAAGAGLGDPEMCESYDEADADRVQGRDRIADADGDGTPDQTFDRQRLRDQVDVES